MIVWTIYCHTSPSGKKYVGQTVWTMQQRWAFHVSNARARRGCRGIGGAIRKYGPEAFTHEVLDAAATQEEANTTEQHWIAKLRTLAPNGYNLSAGGGARGVSDDTRRIVSVNMKLRQAMVAPEMKVEIGRAAASAMWASMTPERLAVRAAKNAATWKANRAQASAVAKARQEAIGLDRRSEIARKRIAAMTPEQTAEMIRKRVATNAAKSPEEYAEIRRKRIETIGHTRLSAISIAAQAAIGKERRSEAARLRWRNRRAKAAAAAKDEAAE